MDTRLERLEALFMGERYAEALELAETLFGEAARGDDARSACNMAMGITKIHANQRRHEAACHWAEQAIAWAERAGVDNLKVSAWVLMASERSRLGQPGPAMQAVSQALRHMQRAGPARRSTSYTGLAFTYRALGMPQRALEAARVALADADPPDDPSVLFRMGINLVDAGVEAWDLQVQADPASAPSLRDELQQALQRIRDCAERREAAGIPSFGGWAKSQAEWLLRTGQAEAASRLLLDHLPFASNPHLEAVMHLVLAEAQSALGQREASIANARRAEPVLCPPGVPETPQTLAMQARIAELLGDGARALQLERRRHALQQHALLAALEARVDELSHELSVQTLKLENLQLRERSEGLAASVRQAEQQAATDALTGLPNRRGLEQAWSLRQATGATSVVAMLDIDHFKAINDRHTHVVGDAVLREVARLMTSALRAGDHIGRYGGEEFAALLDGASLDEAAAAVERLCQRVRAHDWSTLAAGLAVTLSAGVAPVRGLHSLEAAVAQADQLLYAAKAAGRNRVIVDERHRGPLS